MLQTTSSIQPTNCDWLPHQDEKAQPPVFLVGHPCQKSQRHLKDLDLHSPRSPLHHWLPDGIEALRSSQLIDFGYFAVQQQWRSVIPGFQSELWLDHRSTSGKGSPSELLNLSSGGCGDIQPSFTMSNSSWTKIYRAPSDFVPHMGAHWPTPSKAHSPRAEQAKLVLHDWGQSCQPEVRHFLSFMCVCVLFF